MPEEAAPAADTSTASTETSTSQPDPLAAQLNEAVAAKPTPAAPSPQEEHFAKVASKHAETIKQLNEQLESLQGKLKEPAGDSVVEPAKDFWTDPEANVEARLTEREQRLNARIEELQASVNERLNPVDEGIAMRDLQSANPLVRAMIANPDIVEEMTTLVKDKDRLSEIVNGPQGRIAAAMMHVIGKRFNAQADAHANATAPERPENAGEASPSSEGGATGVVSGTEEPKPKNMDEAIAMFSKATAGLPK
jgi:hypothetical protein